MASFDIFYPRVKKWEGGYGFHANDSGGCTNHGITIATWQAFGRDLDGDGDIDCRDVELMSIDDAKHISKTQFWNKFLADNIKNQQIAEILVDWGFNSGSYYPTKKVQELLGLRPDGVFGRTTLEAINKANQKQLYEDLFKAREAFYRNIVASNPSQNVFLQGWLNRLYDFPKTISGATTKNKKVIILVIFLIALLVVSYLYRREILDFYKRTIEKIKQ